MFMCVYMTVIHCTCTQYLHVDEVLLTTSSLYAIHFDIHVHVHLYSHVHTMACMGMDMHSTVLLLDPHGKCAIRLSNRGGR